MTFLRRLKNLWKISALPINIEQISENLNKIEKGTHKMAQIIKRSNPTEEFLKQDEI